MVRPADDDLREFLESNLMAQNVYLVACGVVDGTLELVYETVVPEGGVPPRQVGAVVTQLREYDDWDPQDVAATVTDRHGIVHGTWEIAGEWLERLEAGDIDELEFSDRAIRSVRAWGPRNQLDDDVPERFAWLERHRD